MCQYGIKNALATRRGSQPGHDENLSALATMLTDVSVDSLKTLSQRRELVNGWDKKPPERASSKRSLQGNNVGGMNRFIHAI